MSIIQNDTEKNNFGYWTNIHVYTRLSIFDTINFKFAHKFIFARKHSFNKPSRPMVAICNTILMRKINNPDVILSIFPFSSYVPTLQVVILHISNDTKFSPLWTEQISIISYKCLKSWFESTALWVSKRAWYKSASGSGNTSISGRALTIPVALAIMVLRISLVIQRPVQQSNRSHKILIKFSILN